MSRLPIGSIVLVVVSVLIYFGVAQRMLDRMRLSDKAALAFIVAMFVGTYIPDIPLGSNISMNIGGFLVPLALCVYLFVKADTGGEKARAVMASIVTAAVVYGVNRLLPGDPRTDILDPLYIQGIVAGLVAYLAGRSRRSAFIGGVVGVILSDLFNHFMMARRGILIRTALGGAGVFDGVVIAGIIGVLLAEVIGETRERLQGGPAPLGEGRPDGLGDIHPQGKDQDHEFKSVKRMQPEDTPVQPEDRKEESPREKE